MSTGVIHMLINTLTFEGAQRALMAHATDIDMT